MRFRGLAALLVAPFLVLVAYFALRALAPSSLADVKSVPEGSQEIAWIAPATASDAWERLVAAAKIVQGQWQQEAGKAEELEVNLDQAFLDLTADVPEIAISFKNAERSRLLIRWYKLSGDNDARHWIGKLTARATPPLAIIGGDISDRALRLAQVLEQQRRAWSGPAPLLLITTATAERYSAGDVQPGDVEHATWPQLMDVYQGRSFRFAFTNTRMVEAVLEFVRQNPQVCAAKNSEPSAIAGIIGQGSSLGALGALNAAGHLDSFFLYTLAWLDDGYSKDLAETFRAVFVAHAKEASDQPVTKIDNGYIQYSVGDYYQPNPREDIAVDIFLATNEKFRDQHQLLVLPTAAQRARRLLRTLCRRAPMEVRNVVVLTGDAISFNNVYRDRNVAWNVQDLPVPLVFFSHRNPIDASAGFGKKEIRGDNPSATSTHDILLDIDILQAIVQACFGGGARLATDPDTVLTQLWKTRWRDGKIPTGLGNLEINNDDLFFDAAGNRRPGTGEHIVWLKPAFDGNRNLPDAEITVWSSKRPGPQGGVQGVWSLAGEPLRVRYDRPTPEGNKVHAD